MERVCRACARPARGLAPLAPLAPPAGFDCARALADITGVKISADDGFPRKICRPCIKELKSAWNFKQKCHLSIRKLSHIKTIKRKLEGNASELSKIEEAILFTDCFPEFDTVLAYEKSKNGVDTENNKTLIEYDETERLDPIRQHSETVKEFINSKITCYIENNFDSNFSDVCGTDDEDSPLIKHSNKSKHTSNKLKINYTGKRSDDSHDLSVGINELNKKSINSKGDKNGMEVMQYVDFPKISDEKVETIINNEKRKTKIEKRAKFKKKKMTHDDRRILAVMESLVVENLEIVPHDVPQNVLMKKKDLRDLKRRRRIEQSSLEFEDSLLEVMEKLMKKESTKDLQKCKIKEATHVCSVCAKVYAAESGLRAHMQLHNGYRFICEHCAKGFPSHASLRRHCMSAHGALRPFPCAVCPYRATGCNQLRRHERTHVRKLDEG